MVTTLMNKNGACSKSIPVSLEESGDLTVLDGQCGGRHESLTFIEASFRPVYTLNILHYRWKTFGEKKMISKNMFKKGLWYQWEIAPFLNSPWWVFCKTATSSVSYSSLRQIGKQNMGVHITPDTSLLLFRKS